jgi:hypothetical protein
MRYERWGPPLLRLVIPLLSAYLLIEVEPILGALAQDRPGIVPVATVAFIFGLISAPVRRWLIVTLCFGVTILAVRDTFREVILPPSLNYVFIDKTYPFAWGAIAILGGFAAVGEALRPGTIWARRCYFGAAALYFLGHGSLGFLKTPNWHSTIMMAVGLVSLSGVFMADRVLEEDDEEEPMDEDMRELAKQNAQRASRLAAKEWRENG